MLATLSVLLGLFSVANALAEYKTFKYGAKSDYVLQMRAVLEGDPKTHYLEINTCFPMNKWFGIGFGTRMNDAEIVFFLAPIGDDIQKVVSTVTEKGAKHNIVDFPLASPEIYKNFAKTIDDPKCGGVGFINMYVQRLLKTDGLIGNEISKSLL